MNNIFLNETKLFHNYLVTEVKFSEILCAPKSEIKNQTKNLQFMV